MDNDVTGRLVREWTPSGSAYTGEIGTAAGYSRAYSYDRAGRLTKVIDHTAPAGAAQYDDTGALTGTACQTRQYDFDANGNRISLTRTGANPGGTCATAGGTTKTWNYDTADRITGGYEYDALGRATTIPAVDSPAGASAGDLALGYFDGDQAKTITQSGTSTSFTLDEAGRRSVETTGPTGGAAVKTLTRHYTDGSDNPGWVDESNNGVASTVRYLSGLSGTLDATITTGGTNPGVELTVTDPHGDTPSIIDLPATGNAAGVNGWADTDEYGNRPTTDGTRAGTTNGAGYGWLGSHERATTDHGLILMGVRTYNPASGQFASVDPVFGGNTTAYAYPQDPINAYDLTGKWGCGWCQKAAKKIGGFVSDHHEEILQGASIGTCIVVTTGACLAVTVGASLAGNGISVLVGKKSLREGGKSVAIDTTFGTISFRFSQSIEKYDKVFKLKRREKLLVGKTGELPGASYGVGTLLKKKNKREKYKGSVFCRCIPAA